MIRYSLIFNRKKILSKDGKALIQIRAYNSKQRRNMFFSTGIRLEPKQWDQQKERVTAHHAQYIRLNNILRAIIDKAQSFELKLIDSGSDCSLEMLSNFLLEKNQHPYSFNEFIKRELNNSSLKQSTVLQQRVFFNKLNAFNPSLMFSQIDYEFCCQFELFLIDKGLGKNSIHKEFKNFKKFLAVAIRKGLFEAEKDPFKTFKVKTTPTEITFLTEKEIFTLENIDLSDTPERIQILDLYLFGVYTGLRFSDVMNLTNDMIIKAQRNEWKLEVKMIKTEGFVLLPLAELYNGKAIKIAQRYLDTDCTDTKLFPSFTNQYVNRELKVIDKRANLNKNLKFHSSRHTFATTLLNRGVRIEAVQKLLGHSSLDQTQVYAKLLNTSIINELKAAS
ncbi:site-specific integrase [Reichenbachiella sp.]|uniref:site-specific integrase n=1 Tax=Reichenbachiella sp. TaxID=2184521 RepID=UPI003296CE64